MTLAIILMICGILSIVVGIGLWILNMRALTSNMDNFEDAQKNMFGLKIIFAFGLNILGSASFFVGLIIMIITLVKA